MSPLDSVERFLRGRGRELLGYQREVAVSFFAGESGLALAPTGSGKTFSVFLPAAARAAAEAEPPKGCLQVLWVTPLRALARDLVGALEEVVKGFGLPWNVALRTGDTTARARKKQNDRMPEVLITTPESLHQMLGLVGCSKRFSSLRLAVIDEWHELFSTKRGVLVELATNRLRSVAPGLQFWGLSATLAAPERAMRGFLGVEGKGTIIRSSDSKSIGVHVVIPDELERFPWAGHLGTRSVGRVLEIIRRSGTTLVFTNTRAQTELWYQAILDAEPDLAGLMATHHGSLDESVRSWVEDALQKGDLKVVVCTSSLDLGVDFRPVETVVQVGSPKAVSRLVQRAGRSGHRPGAVSSVHLVPTHTLELLEFSALREGVSHAAYEPRKPIASPPLDVLAQYLVTLALGEGFEPETQRREIRGAETYRNLSEAEWEWVIAFIRNGGGILENYPEYRKVAFLDGLFRVPDRKTAMRHRLSIGTIVSDPEMQVKLLRGGRIGSVEESFAARLKPGDTFMLAGRSLEVVQIRDLTVRVKRAPAGSGGVTPRWMGGRLQLSSALSAIMRRRLDRYRGGEQYDSCIEALAPLLELQRRWSHLPAEDELLVEILKTRYGHHVFFYPFEGRQVHEGLSMVIARRLAAAAPATFSIAMNDYGFELHASQPIDIEGALSNGLLSSEGLEEDLAASVNSTELARRKFREIARVAGLVFQGYPGRERELRHLQASAQLIYDVLVRYEPDNLLVKQAHREVAEQELELPRIRAVLERAADSRIVVRHLKRSSPFAFPILVDSLRNRISSEKLSDRIRRMQEELERAALDDERPRKERRSKSRIPK